MCDTSRHARALNQERTPLVSGPVISAVHLVKQKYMIAVHDCGDNTFIMTLNLVVNVLDLFRGFAARSSLIHLIFELLASPLLSYFIYQRATYDHDLASI